MQKRHDDILTTRLETVIDEGVCYLSWAELYRWYDTKKIAARSYRDIDTRWSELSKGALGALKFIEGQAGMYLFAEKEILSIADRAE